MALVAEVEDAAGVEAELRATQSVLQCAEIDAAIRQLLERNKVGMVTTAADVLAKIFSNILSNPEKEKFRRLKKHNTQVAAKVLVARGALSLIHAVGFRVAEDDGNVLVLPRTAAGVDDEVRSRLEYAVLAVGGVGEAKAAQLAKKSAEAREARLTEVRTEAAARKAAVTRLRSEAEADKATRRQPGWSAKGFEKNDRDVGHLPFG